AVAHLSLFSASAPPSRRCCQARAGRARAVAALRSAELRGGAVHGKRVEDLEGDEARGLWGHSRSHEALRRLEASTSSARRAARSVASLGLGGLFTMRITSCAVSSQSSCATAEHLLLLLLHGIALHPRLLLCAALLAPHRHR